MAVPEPNCSASSSVCCTTLYDTAEFLLTTVAEALRDCIPTECDTPPLDCYVTMAGDDANPNALTVEIESVSPSGGTAQGKGGMQRGLGLYRATFAVRLRESGWPMAYVDDEVIVAPDPALQHFASRHLYSHGEKMYRTLLHMLNTPGGLTPDGLTYASASVTPLIGLLPTAGVAGFVTSVTLDMVGWG